MMLHLLVSDKFHGGVVNKSNGWSWMRELESTCDSSVAFLHQLVCVRSCCGTLVSEAMRLGCCCTTNRSFFSLQDVTLSNYCVALNVHSSICSYACVQVHKSTIVQKCTILKTFHTYHVWIWQSRLPSWSCIIHLATDEGMVHGL